MNKARFLTIIGCAGVIATAVASAKAAVKAKEEKETKTLKKKDYIRIYSLPVLIGASTITCVACAQVTNEKTINNATLAYASLYSLFEEYRKDVREEIGADREDEIFYQACHKVFPDGDALYSFYDELMDLEIKATRAQMLKAESDLNRQFIRTGRANVLDFYRYIDPDVKDPIAEQFGWSCELGDELGYDWIDFDHKRCYDQNEEVYYILGYQQEPLVGYDS